MKKQEILIKGVIHLIVAICAAGTVSLLLIFCSEVLFRDRGILDESLMAWEDFYGLVITALLAIGFLLVPLRSFSFRFWLGVIVMTSALTGAIYVLAAPVKLDYFHKDNFLITVGVLSFTGFLCRFAGQYGKKKQADLWADDQLLALTE